MTLVCFLRKVVMIDKAKVNFEYPFGKGFQKTIGYSGRKSNINSTDGNNNIL